MREFSVAHDTLWEAFADTAKLAQWWGPQGFTNTIHEFDLRVDGRWRFTMHGPNGADYEIEKRFVEVNAPLKVVFDHIQPMHTFRMTMTLHENAGSTRLEWRMLFTPPDEGEKLRPFLLEKNEENFDRLAAFLK
ncbi:MAG: SRPBCC domain-containing protein [Pirellulales bacterium]